MIDTAPLFLSTLPLPVIYSLYLLFTWYLFNGMFLVAVISKIEKPQLLRSFAWATAWPLMLRAESTGE